MADLTPSPDKIPSPVSPAKPAVPVTPGKGAGEKEVAPFAPFMNKGAGAPAAIEKTSGQITPFELAHGNLPSAGPTFASIQDQAKSTHMVLGDISNQLNTSNLKLKQSTKYLLKNKLSAAKAHIDSASDKVGAKKVKETSAGTGAIKKFLGLVTSGQRQLEETQQHIAAIAAKGDEMRPADMLMVQIKLNKAQQQLEYSSMLLGKAVDDLKMMMNIQL